ncbi:sensor histidine kinase [Marivibrio halodurans]|uniref:histidine kinase n=1 Tax=Marivibrio halodurans TaxID=2039722 RepID=A0A8J7SQ69_9PROT|nr:sensor histidine kinase [Marivibrio halodurans]MBP5859083.1 sensor histidine kinase [Marivibrio halodurans]
MPKDDDESTKRDRATSGRGGEKRGAGETRVRRLRPLRRVSPLTRRILAVNMIALLIPVLGLLYLGPYREGLIAQEMEALRTQGEIFSGALGEGAVEVLDSGEEELSLVPARHMIRRLSDPTRVRARLFDDAGEMVADSRQLGSVGAVVEVEELPAPSTTDELVDPLADLVGDVVNLLDDHRYEVYRDPLAPSVSDFPEAVAALNGRIAERVRVEPDQDLILTVALPVQRYYQVRGALMLTKSGEKIEAAMRDVRITIALIFAGALVITVMMSLYLAGTIARPVRRLAEAAERVRQTVGRESADIPDFYDRDDEIGDLSAVLAEMTEALQRRLVEIERFAADVAHEIKNPLTSLRSAVETAARIKDPAQQQRLMSIIQDDVARLDRLISDISDASRLDAELSRSESAEVDLARMLSALAEMLNVPREERAREGGERPVRLVFEAEGAGPFTVRGSEDRLVQVFRNLIGNAESFSPPNGTIRITALRDGGMVEVRVDDEGPGIPPAKLKDIFERFYTERPEAEKFGTHSGLGLSISKQIVEAHDGTITASNRSNGQGAVHGARFSVRLPAFS